MHLYFPDDFVFWYSQNITISEDFFWYILLACWKPSLYLHFLPAPRQETPMVLVPPVCSLPSGCTVQGGKGGWETCLSPHLFINFFTMKKEAPCYSAGFDWGRGNPTVRCDRALLSLGWLNTACPWEVLNESLVFLLPVCTTSALPIKPWIFSLLIFWFFHTSQFSGLANVYSVLKMD